MDIRKLFGFSSWDAYGGQTPEEYAARQRRIRMVWLVLAALGAMWLVLRFLPR
jgi:hypothetical protein